VANPVADDEPSLDDKIGAALWWVEDWELHEQERLHNVEQPLLDCGNTQEGLPIKR
jgi:hypothetical protein